MTKNKEAGGMDWLNYGYIAANWLSVPRRSLQADPIALSSGIPRVRPEGSFASTDHLTT